MLRHARHLLPALLVTTALVGCNDTTAPPIEPDEVSARMGHGVDRGPEINRGLAALRRATARFHNFKHAEAAGYGTQLTGCWIFSGRGAMGFHYGNPALIDAEAELLQPEILVYEPKRSGGLRLVAVEYIVPIPQDGPPPPPPSLLGVPFHMNADGSLYILHIWPWLHNPAGMFEDWNPRASCEHADPADVEDQNPDAQP